jgi:hypothetical protein
MPVNWKDFIDGLKDDAGILAKDELKNLITDSKKDTEIFIKRQSEKMELYLTQLAEGKVTKEQFQGYVLDIRDLTEIQALKLSVGAKARAQRFAEQIAKLVLDSLMKLI